MPNYPKMVVEGKSAPLTNELWLDTNTNPPVLKTHINGEWTAVAGSGSGDDEEEGSDVPVPRSKYTFFPFYTKLVGFVEDTDYDGVSTHWDSDLGCMVATLKKPLILVDDLESYLKTLADDGKYHNIMLVAVTEYDENYIDSSYFTAGVYSVEASKYNGDYNIYVSPGEIGIPVLYIDDQGNRYIVLTRVTD